MTVIPENPYPNQQPKGPLDNPDWTDRQNSEFDKNSTFKTTGQAREDALALGDEVGAKAIEAAKRTIKPVYGPTQLEIADGDKRVETAIEQTTGGSEIIDMDSEKRAHDLSQIEQIKRNLESSSSQEK